MAMAGALLVPAPCTAAAICDGRIRGQCEGGRNARGGRAPLGSGCAVKSASEERNSSAVSSSSCVLQLASSVHRRNEQLVWRGSSHFRGLDQFRIVSKVLSPRKLSRQALRISAENFDPNKIDVNNVVTTLVKLGKQGLEAGTKLVPETVPRPVAQLGVGLASLFVGSFVIRSLFSTVFFILAVGALGYIAFLFLSKGEGGSSSGSNFDRNSGKPKSTDEALEEARRIMDKYK